MPQNKSILTKELLEDLISQGLTNSQIAEKMNLHISTVRKHVSIHGLISNKKDRRKWTDDDLVLATKKCYTYMDVVRELNLYPSAGSSSMIKRKIKELGLDVSHMTGKAHGKTKASRQPNCKPLSEILIKHSPYSSTYNIKRRLIKEGIFENKCDICKIDGTQTGWQGKELRMILDHINGINTDHRIENLRMLCPNRNSQQPSFCKGHNRMKQK